MLDAIMYAVRDGIRGANIGYGVAECEIMDDGRPPPRCGNFFASVHGGKERSTDDNNLMTYYDFSVTLTMRIVVSLDRVADQQVYRNLPRLDSNSVPLAERQGFQAKLDQLRRLLHMNWNMVVVPGQTPPSANDNIINWLTGTVYGFVEPARYAGAEAPKLVGDEWFGADPSPDGAASGVAAEMSFVGARRLQPQTLAVGPYAG